VQIDVRLDEVVLRALEKEPERRYQQVSEIKTKVESIVSTPSPAVIEGGHLVLVARCDGERVIDWPALLVLGLIFIGLVLALMIVIGILLPPGWTRNYGPCFIASSAAGALVFVLSVLYHLLKTPLERLTPLERRKPQGPVL
jgi:hypothetical protein